MGSLFCVREYRLAWKLRKFHWIYQEGRFHVEVHGAAGCVMERIKKQSCSQQSQTLARGSQHFPTLGHLTAKQARPGTTRGFYVSRPLCKSHCNEIRTSEGFAPCFLTGSSLEGRINRNS